jgi:hypothetical protein
MNSRIRKKHKTWYCTWKTEHEYCFFYRKHCTKKLRKTFKCSYFNRRCNSIDECVDLLVRWGYVKSPSKAHAEEFKSQCVTTEYQEEQKVKHGRKRKD